MKRGFTLIELIVVIAIIAILATIIAPNAFKAMERAKVSKVLEDYRAVKGATMAYYADTGVWPGDGVTTAGLVASDGQTGWDGPYIDKWPAQAPWGGAYSFQNDTSVDWDGVAGNDSARYLQITTVPADARTRLDRALDGTTSATSGQFRYSSGTTYFLISTAVDVN